MLLHLKTIRKTVRIEENSNASPIRILKVTSVKDRSKEGQKVGVTDGKMRCYVDVSRTSQGGDEKKKSNTCCGEKGVVVLLGFGGPTRGRAGGA